MSTCNTCAKSFGFFTKERGCPRCKRVFCKNCLSHKVPESADNLKQMIYVCLRCSKVPLVETPKIKKQEQLEELLKLSPKEEAFEPVLEPLPTTSFTDDIRSRLDALKQNDLPETCPEESVEDIQKRLAALKGIEYKDYSAASKVVFATDTRTEQEKIDDLMKQFFEETTIDAETKVEPESGGTIEDIERRLAALRGQDINKTKEQIEQLEETEEEETARTMKQYLEEAKLDDIVLDPDEEELISTIPEPPGGKRDLEELPFCEICNEDATLRCLECENLFCVSCFKEFHYEEDYKTHKTKPYQAPKPNEF